MKRFISVCLIFAMMITTVAYAAPASGETAKATDVSTNHIAQAKELLSKSNIHLPRSADVTNQVAQDLALLEKTMFKDFLEIESIDGSDITYSILYDDLNITDLITVKEDASGNAVVTITEGEKVDTWIYQPDGQVFFNGMRMESCELPAISTQEEDLGISPRVGMRFTMSSAPISYFNQNSTGHTDLVFSSTNFSYISSVATVNSIKLPDFIKNLSVSSIMNVISSSVANKILGLGLGLGATTVSTAISGGIQAAQYIYTKVLLSYGDSKYVSHKIFRYAKKGNNTLHAEFIYAIDSYLKEYCYGDNVVWGVFEIGDAT